MALSNADMIEFETASSGDLEAVVALFRDDVSGGQRAAAIEHPDDLESYRLVFQAIENDPNQRLIVGRFGGEVVSCLQLSVLPCLTHGGTTRAQLEGVRVRSDRRGHGFGKIMIWWTVELARRLGCGLVQLTTDKQRPEALRFYLEQGFTPTHEGLRLML